MKSIYISYSPTDFKAACIIEKLRKSICAFGLLIVVPCENDINMSLIDEKSTYDIVIFFWKSDNQKLAIEIGYAIGKDIPILLVGDYNTVPSILNNIELISEHQKENVILDVLLKKVASALPPTAPTGVYETVGVEGGRTVTHAVMEERVARWFTSNNFKVITIKQPEASFDLMVEDQDGNQTLVEIKAGRPFSEISVAPVRQLANQVKQARAVNGMMISNVPFSTSAEYYAASTDTSIALVRYEDLDQLTLLPHDVLNLDMKVWQLRNRTFENASDLKNIVYFIQDNFDVLKLSNKDVMTLMSIDIVLRLKAKQLGIEGWNNTYFNSNLSGFEGSDVIAKTDKYIHFLSKNGPTKAFNGPDFALRNIKHLFDIVPDSIVQRMLPEIKKSIERPPV